MSAPIHVQPTTLKRFAAEAFAELGLTDEGASEAAEVLVAADLMGFDTHGIAHIYGHPGYAPGLQSGRVNPRPSIRTVHENEATALLDGDGGLGLLVASRAMKLAISKASRVGAGVVAVHNSRHFGASGYYSMLAAENGMIGISLTNAAPFVFPTFGRERLLGTNPISVAAPSDDMPFLCDVTTSTIAMGKIETALHAKEPLEPGWALDGEGRPTTDPIVVLKEGGLTPLGGSPTGGSHKGYALGVAVDVLCGVLTGTGWSKRLDFEATQTGHFFLALNIAEFADAGQFTSGMSDMLGTLRDSAPVAGADSVRVPGQREWEMRSERAAKGIPLPAKLIARLDRFADELGIQSLSAQLDPAGQQ